MHRMLDHIHAAVAAMEAPAFRGSWFQLVSGLVGYFLLLNIHYTIYNLDGFRAQGSEVHDFSWLVGYFLPLNIHNTPNVPLQNETPLHIWQLRKL